MNLLFYLAFIIILLLISLQDFKERAISWWTLPLLLLCSLIIEKRSMEKFITDTVMNLIFITINLLAITTYYSIKNRRFINIIDKQLGLGDVLFFVSCCFIFSITSFILYFLLSMICSVVLVLIVQNIHKSNSVPLAGIMASVLILLSLTGRLFSINFIQGEDWFSIIKV